MGLLSPGSLINANAAVQLQACVVTQGTDGGTVETYSDAFVADVPVLITQLAGDRSDDFGADISKFSGTMTGVSTLLFAYRNVRALVTTAPTDRADMLGWYLRLTQVPHPAGQYGLVGARVTCKWEKMDIPPAVL